MVIQRISTGSEVWGGLTEGEVWRLILELQKYHQYIQNSKMWDAEKRALVQYAECEKHLDYVWPSAWSSVAFSEPTRQAAIFAWSVWRDVMKEELLDIKVQNPRHWCDRNNNWCLQESQSAMREANSYWWSSIRPVFQRITERKKALTMSC